MSLDVEPKTVNELIADLIAFRSVLFKLGFDELADNEKLFVQFANEAGFRTTRGKELTQMNYRQMFSRADPVFLRKSIMEVTTGKVVYSF